MKIKFLVILISTMCFNMLFQNETILNKQEVLFIYFSGDEKERKQIKNESKKSTKNEYYYSFYFNKYDKVELVFKEYADFDEMHRNKPVPYFRTHKSFLKKNKQVILTKEKMIRIGFEETLFKLQRAKNIFLIDKNETEKNKIIIKQVQYLFAGKE